MEPGEGSARALSFGRRAADYERFRPGYPREVIDLVRARRSTVDTALEIGAGTGKATRLFDAAGIAVTALEPDAAMAAVLREHVSARVQVVDSTFEAAVIPGPFDLVYAAAALHWTRPDGRWERIAGLLADGGVAAFLGGGLQLADDDLRARVHEAREPEVSADDHPRPVVGQHPSDMRWPGSEMVASGRFADVDQVVLPRRWRCQADDFVGYLSTLSIYLTLDDARSRDALARVHAVLPDEIEVQADLTVHLGTVVT